MLHLLQRGTELKSGNKIKKQLSGNDEYQLYLTGNESYVLEISSDLYHKWIEDYDVSNDTFSTFEDCFIHESSNEFIISSLESGPFPDTYDQIKNFSDAFKNSIAKFGNNCLNNAIFIEELSVILPTDFLSKNSDPKLVYGKWITGGVNISIDSIDRISKLMSWLPADSIVDNAEAAGFKFLTRDEEIGLTEEAKEPSNNDIAVKQHFKDEKFTLTGRPELEEFFNDNIIDIVINRDKYKKMGIDFPGATILYGPPGCGKTYAIDRLTEYLGFERFDIDSGSIASPYIHDTSKKISEVFDAAEKAAPSIIVIDEMEAFLTDRGMSGATGSHHVEEVAEFLRRIPEAVSKGVLIFAMTNLIDSIDSAILRRGRFDHIVEVKMATAAEIESLLLNKFSSLPIEENVSASKIAEALEGHPLSDVTFILREAGKYAVKNDLDTINNDCFNYALNLLPKKKEKNKVGF